MPYILQRSSVKFYTVRKLNRRHLSEGQKAVLANEYRKVISKKMQSEAGKKAVAVRWHGNEYDEDTLSQSYDEEQERSRKLAAEHMHVAERKVREVQEMEKKIRLYSMAKP